MGTYRILSLDGGGIRGIITAKLLQRLEEAVPGFIAQTDLIAGTSSGGIIAAGLAMGLRPSEMVHLFENNGPTIFKDSFWRKVWTLGVFRGALYTNRNRQRVFEETFGQMKMGDLHKSVLISAFDLDDADDARRDPKKTRSWKAKFFHNQDTAEPRRNDKTDTVVDVLMRATAAPLFFPIYQGYIDGGIVANNPSACALAQALNVQTQPAPIDDIFLLSVGSGNSPRYVESRNGNWGVRRWARPLAQILLEGSNGLADYQVREVLRHRYVRLNVDLPRTVPIDDVSSIPDMIDWAIATDIGPVKPWLLNHWMAPTHAVVEPAATEAPTPTPTTTTTTTTTPTESTETVDLDLE